MKKEEEEEEEEDNPLILRDKTNHELQWTRMDKSQQNNC